MTLLCAWVHSVCWNLHSLKVSLNLPKLHTDKNFSKICLLYSNTYLSFTIARPTKTAAPAAAAPKRVAKKAAGSKRVKKAAKKPAAKRVKKTAKKATGAKKVAKKTVAKKWEIDL